MKPTYTQQLVGLVGVSSLVAPLVTADMVALAADVTSSKATATRVSSGTISAETNVPQTLSQESALPITSEKTSETTLRESEEAVSTEPARETSESETTSSTVAQTTTEKTTMKEEASSSTTATTSKEQALASTTLESDSAGRQSTTDSAKESATPVPSDTHSAEAKKAAKVQSEEEGEFTYVPNQTTTQFIQQIGLIAQKVAQQNDLYASVMIAQAILESASGNSGLAAPPNYNLFGIKGTYQGKGTTMRTAEDSGNGQMYTIQAQFRKYPGYQQSLEDYAKLLKTNFYRGTWKSQTKDYHQTTRFLTGRYATDTSYYRKLDGLIQTYHLAKYDDEQATETVAKTSVEAFIEKVAISLQEKGLEQQVYPSYLIAEAILQTAGGELNRYKENGEWLQRFSENDVVKKAKNFQAKELQQLAYYQTSLTRGADFAKQRTLLLAELSQASGLQQKDAQYAQKIDQLIAFYDLTKYDQALTGTVRETETARNFRQLEVQERQAQQITAAKKQSSLLGTKVEENKQEELKAQPVSEQKSPSSLRLKEATQRKGPSPFVGYYAIQASNKKMETMHVVKNGDTLLRIAQHYHVTVKNLIQWNPKVTLLTEGQQIRISSPSVFQKDQKQTVFYL